MNHHVPTSKYSIYYRYFIIEHIDPAVNILRTYFIGLAVNSTLQKNAYTRQRSNILKINVQRPNFGHSLHFDYLDRWINKVFNQCIDAGGSSAGQCWPIIDLNLKTVEHNFVYHYYGRPTLSGDKFVELLLSQ